MSLVPSVQQRHVCDADTAASAVKAILNSTGQNAQTWNISKMQIDSLHLEADTACTALGAEATAAGGYVWSQRCSAAARRQRPALLVATASVLIAALQ